MGTVDLVALIRETKAQIAKLQGVLDAARAELDIDTRTTVKASPSPEKSTVRSTPVNRRRRRGRRQGSSVTWSAEILANVDEMHVNDILARIKERFHKTVDKQTLVGNLARMVKDGDTFKRTGPNTYALIENPRQEKAS